MGNGTVPSTSGPAGAGYATNVGKEETAVVQKTETSLGQVADRLGYSEDELQKANPQIPKPFKVHAGMEIHLPEKVTTARAGEKPADIAKRLDVKEDALRKANPQIKDWNNLKAGDRVNNPEYYAPDATAQSRPMGTRTKPRKIEGGGQEEQKPVDISEKGATAKIPGGKARITTGGGVVYLPPKIGPVQPTISRGGVAPGIPEKDEPIPDHTAASRQQDDWKRVDDKTKEKLDNQQKGPGRTMTDREVKKGFDGANGAAKQQNIDRDFERRQAIERIKHPLPKTTMKMRDE